MDEIGFWLGFFAVFINTLLFPLLIFALFTFKSRNRWDIQNAFLLLSTALSLPVFFYESVLFIHLFIYPLNIQFPETILKISFAFGLFGIVLYNLQFFLLKDFPTFPISLIAVWTGIAIGGMAVGLHLDVTSSIQPIFYDPLSGGLEFVGGQLMFNLIGYGILSSSIIKQRKLREKKFPNVLTLFGVVVYFIAPFIVIMQRIFQVILQPFNLLLLPYELGLLLGLLSYVMNPEKSVFSPEIALKNVSIIDLDSQTVIAGYSNVQEETWTKLSSMVVLATDSILKEILNLTVTTEMGKYNMTYGDTVFVKRENFIVFSLFGDTGNKLGKFLLGRMAKGNEIKKIKNRQQFRILLIKYLYPFFQNQPEPENDKFFYQKPIEIE